jgi:UDP-N-acetylmuramyl pentapeptide phosphotransferase/UDP-N-acetylglucosamine-1-phosphate transferase/glycosyltransferase involved in cell wall biosynthesis
MDLIHLVVLLSAMAVAVAVTPLTIRLARTLGLMDRPDARKVHATPIPRLGGIAITFAIMAATLGGYFYLQGRPDVAPPGFPLQLLAIAGAGSFIFLVGLVDDIRSVSSRFKLLALVAASLMVCGSGTTFGVLRFGGEDLLQFQWLAWLVTVFWIVAITVAINFIDGLDGLAAGLALLTSAVLAWVLLATGMPMVALLPLAMCGALIGFLVYNWHPARTFMGDGGSLTLGFLLGATTVMANPLVGTMRGVVLPAMALSIPLVDAALTFFRRHYLQRRSIFSAEQGHIHHQLLRRGMTQTQAVVTIYLVSLLALAIGVISLAFEGAGTLGGLALAVPLLWGVFRLAGSIRTSEMLEALRSKRHIDRTSRRYRNGFEMLQLEFAHVDDFAGWWQGVCRAADRLDFISVSLPVTSRDGSIYQLEWKPAEDRYEDCARLTASVPIADRRAGADPLEATVQIASTLSLESAGERLALFTRLMHEHSLASLLHRAKTRPGKARPTRPSASANESLNRLPPEARGPFGDLRVAIVHDFLYVYAGAERVVEQLIHLFPHCDVFALFDFLPEDQRHFLQGKPVTTSLMQHLPFARKRHRAYLPMMPLSIEQLDVSEYDLVISSSYLAAKGVITGPDQLHVSYCHSPARYAWDLQHQYLDSAGIGFGIRGILARAILHYIRNWDTRSSFGVDHFIANSHFVAKRIEKLYRREATVIHAPVDTDFFVPSADDRDDYYLAVGRMVPYKRTDLVVGAFNKRPDLKLKVIGDGPEFEKIRRIAGPNIELLGYQDAEALRHHLQKAKALVFAAEEDFGIVPVEAMACGTPVIAYGKGGVTESVLPGKHGVMFARQTVESLHDAIDRFERMDFSDEQTQADIRHNAEGFSQQRFLQQLTEAIESWVSAKWPERPSHGRSRTAPEESSARPAPKKSAVAPKPAAAAVGVALVDPKMAAAPAAKNTNGHANGHTNGHTNGHSNGHSHGPEIGHSGVHSNGHSHGHGPDHTN